MKKWISWILILCLGLSLTACGKVELPEDYKPTANENPFIVQTGYKKPEIALDGVLDDARWENVAGFTFGDTISADVKAFYGENGIYVGAIIHDDELWAMSSSVYDNTSFEVYLDYSGEGGMTPGSEQIQIFIDVMEQSMVRRGSGGLWVDTSLIKNYAVKVNGTVGEHNPDNSYGVELFIPYSQLGGEPQVDYGIAFGLVGCRDSIREIWRGVPGINVQSPETYMKFYRDTGTIETERKVNTANLNIDGKADEDAWKDAKIYSFGDGARGGVSTYFDEKGAYFFLDMKDNQVCYDGSTVFMNDSIEIYLDPLSNGGKCPQYDDVQIRVDVQGTIEFLRGQGTTIWYNASNAVFAGAQIKNAGDGYTVEVYVPWVDLGLEKKPESMQVSFGSVDWDGKVDSNGNREISWSGIGTDPQLPDDYVKITAKGVEGAAETAPEPEVKLDGKLSDAKWNGAASYFFHDGTVQVNWFWTANGCYFGFAVSDNNVKTEGSKPFENSSVEVYLDYNYNGGNPDSKDRTILVDAAGNMLFRKGVDGIYQDFATASIQSGVSRTSTGYMVELYIPWSEFGGGKPSKMGVAFGHVTLVPGQSGTVWTNDGLCPDPQDPDWYSGFTASAIG